MSFYIIIMITSKNEHRIVNVDDDKVKSQQMRRKGKGSPTYKRSGKEFTERNVYDSDFTATLPLH